VVGRKFFHFSQKQYTSKHTRQQTLPEDDEKLIDHDSCSPDNMFGMKEIEEELNQYSWD